jgi:hypothetical protein
MSIFFLMWKENNEKRNEKFGYMCTVSPCNPHKIGIGGIYLISYKKLTRHYAAIK